MAKPNVIRFYRTNDEFGEFSNFAAFPIRLKGVIWPTTEHYFQAQKFAGTSHEENLRLADSPSLVARMGRDRDRPLRPDWEAVKDDIMREAVLAKFLQHASLASLLLSTGDAEIIEHTRNDAYWADGGDGNGLNMLGRILMEVRATLGGKPIEQVIISARNPEGSLRRVRYERHEFHHEPEGRESSLLAFIYDIPYFEACGIFPPFHLLNDRLRSGGSEGGMGPGATWTPFELSREEYDDLVAAVRSVPVETLRERARYAFLQFRFDPSLDHFTDYIAWMNAVCDKHRAQWHVDLRDAGFMK